jgi:hypothetical protein
MSDINPYQSPETHVSAVKPMISSGTITQTMRDYLKGASGWMRFMGIMGFISCGFTVLSGLFMFFLPALFMRLHELDVEELVYNLPGVFGAFGGILYILMAAIVFFLALFLYKAGTKIRDYTRTGADSDLEEALRNNRAFWKFFGIITIISIALIPLIIIGGVVAALAGAAAFL